MTTTYTKPITMGSLFDGIGGFPYAASFFDIQTLWASEIMPTAISVTKRHLPNMKHVGDITTLDGATLPPVDIITFGSPCQGLSAAGKRKGLSDPRSGLFLEAIRIIKEMREATNGQYPRFALWENVPGAMHSNRGLDFKAVLEAFTDSEVPFPKSGKWTKAGMVVGGGTHLSWCVYNSQYFGTAQRRRRIFLVCDFIGSSSAEILFIPKSLQGYFEAGGTPRQNTATHALQCADGGPVILNDQGGNSLNVEKNEKSPTLRSETHGNLPVVAMGVHQNQSGDVNTQPSAYSLTTSGSASARNAPLIAHEKPCAFSLDGAESNSMKSKNPLSGCRLTETARTIDTTNPCPSKNQGGLAIVETHPRITGTLCASGAGLSRPGGMCSETDLCVAYCLQGSMIGREDKNGPKGSGVNEEVSFTLNTVDNHCVAFSRQRSDLFKEDTIASTQTARQCKDATDLICKTQCVSAVDCRNYKEIGNLSGTLQAKNVPGYSLNFQNPVRCGYVVRRLTPTECERLQGFPDGWTAFAHDDKPISDTKRYQMLGNAVAVPCVAYIMIGIVEAMRNEVK